MPNGGTITNRLSDDITFTLDVKWIAAARQGGTASATYVIQYQKADGSWTAALDKDGNPISLTIPNFGAETMELTKEFTTAVPMYDESGKKIEYRIVQTTVSRTDKGFTGTYGEVDSNETITLHNEQQNKDGDQYQITITPPAADDKTNTWNFQYKLTGNYDIYIQKIWDDTKNPDHSEEHPVTHADQTIDIILKRGSFTNTEYTNYKDDIKIHLTDHDYRNTDWTVKQIVPIYDDEGHEYFYKIEETTSLPNYYRTYSYDEENKVYTVKNTYSSGPVHYIKIQKEWQNDGELEYKKALNVHAEPKVFLSSDNNEINTNGQTVVVNEQNVWYNEVYRDKDYTFDKNDFSENADNRNVTTKELFQNKLNNLQKIYSYF